MIKDKVNIKVMILNSQLIAATHWGYDARKMAIRNSSGYDEASWTSQINKVWCCDNDQHAKCKEYMTNMNMVLQHCVMVTIKITNIRKMSRSEICSWSS